MVQQLSPLALYLKHLAEFGDLIIIDEPESNLHPEAQKKVVEIIAEMVNRGLWVIITTHSPFIIDYLNTLMKAYKVASISDEAKEQVLEVIKNENALLNPENVGVYLFTKEGLIENVKKDYIIDLESFRKIIDEIGAMFTDLLIIEDIYQKSEGETDDATD
jgi:ABC-type multidrug transport system ATPase subunit